MEEKYRYRLQDILRNYNIDMKRLLHLDIWVSKQIEPMHSIQKD